MVHATWTSRAVTSPLRRQVQTTSTPARLSSHSAAMLRLMRRARAASACLALGALGTVGCVSLPASRGTEPPPQPAAAHITRTQFVQESMPLDPSYADDYVVRVVAGDVTCSGTLIHDDRVLTAHHCVAKRNRVGVALGMDRDPATIRVELGGDYLPWDEVGVRAVVAPPCGYDAGQGDIAILVLERRSTF